MAKGKAAAEMAPVAAEDAASSEGGNGEAGGPLMIDFGSVPDEAARPVIPRGVYAATVDELTFGHSQASGNPMWTWRFEITQEGDYLGRKLFFHTPFVENMLPRVKKVLSRIAPELLEGAFSPEQIANDGVLLGKDCQIRVDVRPYEGKPSNNVRDVLGAAEGGGSSEFLQM